MGSVAPKALDTTPRVALYARVSSDEQAERGTIENQAHFLRRYCDLYDLPIVETYLDDGASGTRPLAERPEGRRLLADAGTGRFGVVLVYKVDRLGRSLAPLLDAHRQLEAHGVTIRSATEPFDTAEPMGRFLFQLLGSMAELDRATLLEKLTLGRDRGARAGRWYGVVPFGYDLDADGCLVPSTRLVEGLGCTEAELVQDLFSRIAGGATLWGECQRLNALGVAPVRRYASGKVIRVTDAWRPARLCGVLHNPVYTGTHTLHSKHGAVAREVPALVPLAVWEQAQRVLASNRKLSKTGQAYDYLLRGLVRCANCGSGYTGAVNRKRRRDGTPYETRYYRCNWDFPIGAAPCAGKAVNADALERAVWTHCAAFIRDPGAAIAEAQAELRARQAQAADRGAERARLTRALADKDAERERTMTLFRKNLITLAEAEVQLAAMAREQAETQALLAALDSETQLTAAAQAQLADATAMLGRLRDRLEEVERTDDWATKRAVVELLVRQVTVETTGTGRERRAVGRARYAFGPEVAAVAGSGCAWR